MGGNCKLCGRPVGDGGRCTCGWRMDERCRANHERACPADGSDAWVGVQEF